MTRSCVSILLVITAGLTSPLYGQFFDTKIEEVKTHLIGSIRSAIEDTTTIPASPQKAKLAVREPRPFMDAVLQHEEKRLLKELDENFGIETADVKQRILLKSSVRRSILSIEESVPESVAKRVRRSLARDFNLTGVHFSADQDDDIASCGCDRNIILHKYFNDFAAPAQDAVIGHESFHAQYEDKKVTQALQSLLNEGTKDAEHDAVDKADAFFKKWCRFIEMRADMKTAAVAEQYAHGLVLANEQLLRTCGDAGSRLHPRNSRRVDASKKAYDLQQLLRLKQTRAAAAQTIAKILNG